MAKAILAPAAMLVLWTLVVMVLLAFTRAKMVGGAPREKLKELPRAGGRGEDLERAFPGNIHWVAHNYGHLLEQPTIFYATVLTLAVTGAATALDVRLAWGYLVLRVLHSVWQIFVNTVNIRFVLFLLSSLCLLWLAVNALRATLF